MSRMARAICSVHKCGRICHGQGFCKKHYLRFWRHGDASIVLSTPPKTWNGVICSVNHCKSKVRCQGMCERHYRANRVYGNPLTMYHATPGAGHNHQGYKRQTNNNRRIFEHRLVWEAANGPIPTGHHIHHINGDRGDNRLENLQCLLNSEHMKLHQLGKTGRKHSAETRRKMSESHLARHRRA